jgi:hypothetical protein
MVRCCNDSYTIKTHFARRYCKLLLKLSKWQTNDKNPHNCKLRRGKTQTTSKNQKPLLIHPCSRHLLLCQPASASSFLTSLSRIVQYHTFRKLIAPPSHRHRQLDLLLYYIYWQPVKSREPYIIIYHHGDATGLPIGKDIRVPSNDGGTSVPKRGTRSEPCLFGMHGTYSDDSNGRTVQ